MNSINIMPPYLIFLGTETNPLYAKTGAGIALWRPELCDGQLNLAGGTVDLGLPQRSVKEAAQSGAQSLVIGTTLIGGHLPDTWLDTLEEALLNGMDIVAGLHTNLNNSPRLVAAAEKSGKRLINVRIPPDNLIVGTGKKRTGKRLLTVGTDCALGKKYSALAIERDMINLGINAEFRASGQTGIMIAGAGIPIDAVVADFISGAAEQLSPNNHENHWDIIEGQGSVFHPGYAGVSIGLLTGSQPDAFVVCTDAKRTHIEGWPHFKLPTIAAVIERTLEIGRDFNPDIQCVGICVNTSDLSETERASYLMNLSQQTELPCVDPIQNGTVPIIKHMDAIYNLTGGVL